MDVEALGLETGETVSDGLKLLPDGVEMPLSARNRDRGPF
jgi:hypothetical protein